MKIVENEPLRDKTTIRVGGPARYFCVVRRRQDLADALNFARQKQLPILWLGGGSNVIPTDAGFAGLVVRFGNDEMRVDGARRQIRAGAGMMMSELVRRTTERGWRGLEWAGGLPGTVGGAIRGNAGAFGGEIKDSVVSVTTVDPTTGERRVWDNAACQFVYRSSVFKTRSESNRTPNRTPEVRFGMSTPVIWEAVLQFEEGDPVELTRAAEEKVVYRCAHHPQEPSAGSIFQNLTTADLPTGFFDRWPEFLEKVRAEKLAAGALLDALGMKGRRAGGALISERHANFIVNTGRAAAADVRALANEMKTAVKDRYGIELREEPEFLD